LHLQKDSPELLDEESKLRMENKTIAGAEHLLNAMEDLLLWSKGQMENFQPHPKTIRIHSLFEDIKTHFASEEKVTILFENPNNIEINTDENYLKTILRNLTGNAIKALEKIENPHIIWKVWQENTQTFLSITDNGFGGTQEQFKALYDEKEVVGIKTGLGLHLIRDLAKAIHCEIKVHSTANSGTTITLSFQ
jgi:signal transduction histidine kinase